MRRATSIARIVTTTTCVLRFVERVPRCSLCAQVIDAKTPQAVVGVQGEDARVDNRYLFYPDDTPASYLILALRMLKDDRVKETRNRSIFVQDDFTDRIG